MRYSGFLILGFLLLSVWSTAQSRQDLEKQRNEIIKRIELTSSNLKKNESSKANTLKDLRAIENQISERKALIAKIREQITSADAEIVNNQKAIDSIHTKLDRMKTQYHELLRVDYLKGLSENKWIYIFSASSLNEAFLRWRYQKQFEQFMASRTEELTSLTKEIQDKTLKIADEKKYKTTLLADENENFDKLQSDQKTKDRILANLKKNESKLRQELAQQKKERENLNVAIENIILAELRKRNEAKTSAATEEVFTKNISKGNIGWPAKGYISSKFGNQPHPTIPGLKINNNGIDITCGKATPVKAVADGKVLGITTIPGYDNMVIIQHGEYYTVYSKLEQVSVVKEQVISSGSVIGKLKNIDGAELHFELWKNKTKLNPEDWLGKR